MNRPDASPTPQAAQVVAANHRLRGIVERIDLVERELSVRLATGHAQVHVPPGCPVLLRGEPVKLRLVQQGDDVVIAVAKTHDRLAATLLLVQPNDEIWAHELLASRVKLGNL